MRVWPHVGLWLPESQSDGNPSIGACDLNAAHRQFVVPLDADVVAHVVLRLLEGGDELRVSRRLRFSTEVGRLACRRSSRSLPANQRQSASAARARGARRAGRSGGAPFVSVMEATDLRDGDDGAFAGWPDRPMNRRVFVQHTCVRDRS